MSLRFTVFSDIHLNTQASVSVERLADSVRVFGEALARELTERPDFIVYSGDIFEARYDALTDLEQAYQVLSQTTVPWFVIPGNHDSRYKVTRDGYTKADFARRFAGHGPVEDRTYWCQNWPETDVSLVGLDTSCNFTSEGLVDEAQMAWLESVLRERPQRRVIVFMHHPTVLWEQFYLQVPAFKIYLLNNHQEVSNLLCQHRNVKLVVSGHTHTCRHTERDGLHFVNSPSIISWPGMYTRFQLSQGLIEYEHIEALNPEDLQRAFEGTTHPNSANRQGFATTEDLVSYFGRGARRQRLTIRDVQQKYL